MTIGKYYCDYCDKEFQDTAAARKRHLQGFTHQRNKKLWYDSHSHSHLNHLTGPSHASALPPETYGGKGLCHRFLKSGICPFGDSCKYHHPKHNWQGEAAQVSGISDNLQPQIVDGSLQGQVASQSFGMSLGNLPPSLRPPPENGYPPLPFVDWG